MHGFILAVLVVYAAPIIGIVLTSLQTDAEISARGVWHIPENATLDNFAEIWRDTPMQRYLINSFLVTIPATVISVAGGVLLGYVFSQFRFPFAELLFLVVIAGMFFPPQAMLIPLFRQFDSMGPLRHALSDDHRPCSTRDVHHDATDAQLHDRAPIRAA